MFPGIMEDPISFNPSTGNMIEIAAHEQSQRLETLLLPSVHLLFLMIHHPLWGLTVLQTAFNMIFQCIPPAGRSKIIALFLGHIPISFPCFDDKISAVDGPTPNLLWLNHVRFPFFRGSIWFDTHGSKWTLKNGDPRHRRRLWWKPGSSPRWTFSGSPRHLGKRSTRSSPVKTRISPLNWDIMGISAHVYIYIYTYTRNYI